MGSDVVVVDPPRKGLDASLANMLRDISSFKRKVKSLSKRLDLLLVFYSSWGSFRTRFIWMTSKVFEFSFPDT